MTAPVDTPWMTAEEAGSYARTSAKAIRDHLTAGDLVGSKPGRLWLIHRDDLDAWLRGRRVEMRILPARRSG